MLPGLPWIIVRMSRTWYVYDDNTWDQIQIYVRVKFELPSEFLNYRITALTIWESDSLTALPNLSTDRLEMEILNLQNKNAIKFGKYKCFPPP